MQIAGIAVLLAGGYAAWHNHTKLAAKKAAERERISSNIEFIHRQEHIYDLVPPHKSQIVFLGDSQTRGGPFSEVWPCGVNRGVAGATSADILSNIEPIRRLNPETVILMVGTNDVLQDISASETYQNVQAIITALKPASVTVLGIPPMVHKDVAETNRVLATVTGYKDVGFTLDDVSPDGVHLLPSGYRKWLGAIDNMGCTK